MCQSLPIDSPQMVQWSIGIGKRLEIGQVWAMGAAPYRMEGNPFVNLP